MANTHGVYVFEVPTKIVAPTKVDSALQVVIGTSPINLTKEMPVNVPVLVNNYAEAVEKLGYSKDFKSYTLSQSIYANFQIFNIAPIVFINVLDPEKHKKSIEGSLTLDGKRGKIEREGILVNTLILMDESENAYEPEEDYIAIFNSEGHIEITLTKDTRMSENETIKFIHDELDPSMVTPDDVAGGYDATKNRYTGIETVRQVFPKFGLVPGLILAPGFSHFASVRAALVSKSTMLNSLFEAVNLLDVNTQETKDYSEVYDWKKTNGCTSETSILCYPKVKAGGKELYMSALLGALMAYTDVTHKSVPYQSPSNRNFRIESTVLEGGEEILLDLEQANTLNGQGIFTAINMQGFKSWGNNTACYPENTDVKDRFISVRRMFDFWSNSFILTYWQEVDDPLNYRLIESVVNTENRRADGYVAAGMIAGAGIEFNEDENPVTDILNGVIKFHQYLTPFPPAETIVNTLEFDPNILLDSLKGE